MKRGRKKRKKLLALLSSLVLLLAGAIGTGVAFGAMAAVKKSSTSPSSPSSPVSSSPSSQASLQAFKRLYFKAEGESGQKAKEVEFLLTSPSSPSSMPSSPSPSSFKVPKGSFVSYSKNGDLLDLTHEENGVFSFEAKPGEYEITMQRGESEAGRPLLYGSYYFAPTFKVDLSKNGETLTSVSDPFGFVNPSEKEVVVGSSNPASKRVEGDKLSSSPFSSLPGPSHSYSYQMESFLPFVQSGKDAEGKSASLAPLSLLLSLPSQTLVKKSVEVNSLPLSSLKGASLTSSSPSSAKLTFSPLALETIEEKGKSPLPSSSLLTQEGNTDRQLSITFEAYLSPTSKGSSSQASAKAPSKTSSSSSTFEFDYQAWMGKNPKGKEEIIEPKVVALSSAGKKEPLKKAPAKSLLSSSTENALPCVGQDGKPLKQVTVLIANPASGGNGYSVPYVFTNSNTNVAFGDIGLPPGSKVTSSYQGDTVTFEGSDITVFGSTYFTVQLTPISGVNQEGQSVSYGSYYVAPQIYLNPSASATVQVWSPFLDYSSQGNVTQIEVGADNPSVSRVDASSLSTSPFTATVGSLNPYTYQATSFLPYSYGGDYINSGNSFLPADPLSFTLYTPGQSIILTSLKVNDLSFLSLFMAGDVMYSISGSTFTLQFYPGAFSMISSEGSLPFPSSGLLTQNGITDRTLSVEWNAYLDPSFTSSSNATFAFYYEDLAGNQGQGEPSGSPLKITPEVSTNGPANNSVPSSLSKATTSSLLPTSSPSSSTGLWFINGLEDACGADITQFTVQNSSGKYLTPVENDGAFEGWQFSSSPYDFKGLEFDKLPYYYLFAFGGLQDGTYTLKSVKYPAVSFTSSLIYSSPEALTGSGSFSFVNPQEGSQGVSWRMEYGLKGDVLEMTNSTGDPVGQGAPDSYGLILSACHIPVTLTPPSPAPAPLSPSHLPFTGGRGVLFISLLSCPLFLLGLGGWYWVKRKRGGHASGSNKHGF